jgi:DME family drug/metabolite transporter
LVGATYGSTLVLFVLANKATTAANSIFLQSTAPLYILLFSPWLLRERITRKDVLFLLAMAIGLALFFVDEEKVSATASDPFLGNLFALGSGVAWAFTVMGLRWLGSRTKPASAGVPGASHASSATETPVREGFGAIVAGNTLAFLAAAPLAFPVRGSGADWSIVLYLGVFQIALAYVFVTTALRAVPAFEASVLLLIEPVLNPLWAWIVHGEQPGPWALAGGALILCATFVKARWDTSAEPPAPRGAAVGSPAASPDTGERPGRG